MTKNLLQLTESKTEMILWKMGSFNVHSHARNVGVIFDSALTFYKLINSVVKGSFFNRRTIVKLKSFLSFKDLEMVIHALLSSQIDYCNSLYYGIC